MVSVVAQSGDNLKKLKKIGINTIKADLSVKPIVGALIKDYDIIVNALPGQIGFEITRTVVDGVKNIVDISYHPHDIYEIDLLAKKKNVIVLTDFGVSPGLTHILAGQAYSKLDKV